MIVTFWKGVFVADHQPVDVPLLKKAGFRLHEPTLCDPKDGCRGCRASIGRRYFSPRIEHATRLRKFCNPRALAVMKEHLEKLSRSRATDSAIKIPAPPGCAYKPYQKAGVAYAVARKDTLFGDDMGLGKDQPLDAKILTPTGWTTMGELMVGSIVLGSDRRPTTVTGVYPQGNQLVFQIVLRNGAVTECGLHHLWLVLTHYSKPPVVKTTAEIMKEGVDHHYVPVLDDLPQQIVSIRYRSRMPTQCIAVDAPDHLYVTNDYILTHNTVEALGVVNYLHPKKLLIVAPATLQLNWLAEVKKWLVDSYRFHLPKTGEDAVPETGPDQKIAVITNYEKVVGLSRGGNHVETPLSRSLYRQWDVGIFDEAQALKNPEAMRTQVVLGENGLYEHTRRALFLTGTPMENRPIEIWPIAASLCPARFGDWWDFARRYCGLHQEERGRKVERIEQPDGTFKLEGHTRKVWVADGATNHSELQQRLRTSFMIRRLKTDVLKELPPKRRQLIVLDDSQIDWQMYPEFLRWKQTYQADFDAAMARLEAARTMVEYKKAVKELTTITVPFTETSDVRHKSALLKLPACLKLSDEIRASGLDALVIFAHHRDVLEQIHQHYGEKSCVIYGDTPQKDRIPLVNAFQAGQWDILIGGLKAAGTGLTMTRANTVIFFESDWNPATMRQAEDRLCRIGQKKMVHAIYPVLNNSLDANMLRMTVTKQNVIDRMLDEVPEEIRTREGFSSKIYEEVGELE